MEDFVRLVLLLVLLFIVAPLLALSIGVMSSTPQYAVLVIPQFTIALTATAGIGYYLYRHRRVKCQEGP